MQEILLFQYTLVAILVLEGNELKVTYNDGPEGQTQDGTFEYPIVMGNCNEGLHAIVAFLFLWSLPRLEG